MGLWHLGTPSSSVMLRRLRRLRVTVLFYTSLTLFAILLLVTYTEDVKRLLQQSPNLQGSQHALLPSSRRVPPPHHVQQHAVEDDASFSKSEPPSSQESLLPLVETQAESSAPPGNSGVGRPWYMLGGTVYPGQATGLLSSAVDEARLWYEDNLNKDRVLEQLMFWIDDPTLPPPLQNVSSDGESGGSSNSESAPATEKEELAGLSTGSVPPVPSSNGSFPQGQRREKLKTILLYYGLGMSWGPHVTSGRGVFLQQKCPVNACRLTGNRAHMAKADVVLFKDVFMNPKVKRNPAQLWIMYMLECPLNTQNFVDKNVFNLTATYRHDSDIVTPYEKWVYYEDKVRRLKQGINYAEGKSKKVAWFVSNCVAKNNRLDYARELSKYIEVDIYGACGTHSCSRANAKQCFDLLAKNYKFYLAFENSNCRDYISEKFFVNGLGNNVLPIVMGAHPDDYKRVAPAKSYIHVDDFPSPKELAQYLYMLDANDELYNEYFQWKGTGEFINTHFFCRLCAMAHYADKSQRKPRHYKDFNKWWRGPNVCTRRSWRNQPDVFSPAIYDPPTVSGA